MTNRSLTWSRARSLDDLGELTARWLIGSVPDHPSQDAEPDPETKKITRVLVRLNRAGWFTEFSQPAERLDDGFGQRASLSGLCDEELAKRVASLSLHTDLIVLAFPPGCGGGYQIPITVDEHRPFTWAGSHEPEFLIRDFAEKLGDKALVEVARAWHVTVIDSAWGRPRYMWKHVERATMDRNSSPFDVTPALEDVSVDFVY